MKQARLDKVLQEMADREIPQMLVCDPAAIFYLTGQWIHPGERMMVLLLNVAQQHRLFINELFSVKQDVRVPISRFNDTQDAVEIVSSYVGKENPIGIDKNWPSRFLLRLMELKGDSQFINSSIILDQCRMCKDSEEIEIMREASKMNDVAMGKLIKVLPEKYSEAKYSQLLLGIYEELGAQGCSFNPNISFGANGADPHHKTGNSLVKEGDSIVIDIGCKKDSYCSDMTRTVFYKYASDQAREVYNTVLDANKKAIDSVKPGVRFCDIDAVARKVIEAAGYGKYFIHRTGHCIGLEAHDFGDVSSINTDEIKPGMIFSIEPGIYLPGEFGVRIEDLVLVTEKGCEILNHYNKELTIIE